jgi:hypothetical protein
MTSGQHDRSLAPSAGEAASGGDDDARADGFIRRAGARVTRAQVGVVLARRPTPRSTSSQSSPSNSEVRIPVNSAVATNGLYASVVQASSRTTSSRPSTR